MKELKVNEVEVKELKVKEAKSVVFEQIISCLTNNLQVKGCLQL